MSAPFGVIRPLLTRTCKFHTQYWGHRTFCSTSAMTKGLVLGIYQGEKDEELSLTKAAQSFQTSKADNLTKLIQISGLSQKKGKQRVFYGLDPEYSSIAIVSLGKKDAGFNEQEELDQTKDNIRIAVAAGVKHLKEAGVKTIHVDPCGDAEAAAEAAHLSVYVYDELKTDEKKKVRLDLKCYTDATDDPESLKAAWNRGTMFAEGQNLAKKLMEAPANVMTPTQFTSIAKEKMSGLGKVQVRIRDKEWVQNQKMGSFLSVAKGSDEPLRFLEVQYDGGKEGDAPLAIVGKGVTFDSGGISIKGSAGMEDMRADMGGAACTLGAIYTAARLNIPINVIGLMPLCENLLNGLANKPGDVVTAMNGKTIQIDNTDAEGRLILADALVYAETFKPRSIIDMATLTGGMMVALGSGATGCFTHSSLLWDAMHKAGMRTGDRVWRMPLFKHYSKQVTESHLADINNVSSAGRWGSACTAAAFLCEFVTHQHWMHLDIAGVASLMGCKTTIPYMSSTVTGRPTRTIVEFMNILSKHE